MIQALLLMTAGIVMFLFGMMKLGAAVQQFFTARIRESIRIAVKKPLYGLLTGITATILFQSSSATTFLTVGMVSAGLVTFFQSMGIILGADIGTTLTIQLVVWKFTEISPLFLIIGGTVWLLGKDIRQKIIGEAIFYFGLIFFGLNLAAMATAPLKDHPAVLQFFQNANHPLSGLIIGILFTGLVHASAIPISILVILAQHQLMTLDMALPIVLGANVGTTVTALMAGAVADLGGRRSALAHLFFKCTGVLVCLILLPGMIRLLKSMSGDPAQQIVLGHFFLNFFIAVVFIGLLKPCARLIEKILPGRAEVLSLWPEFLDEKKLVDPEAALDSVQKELAREIALTKRMVLGSVRLMEAYRESERRNILYIEPVVDNLRKEMVRYLWEISCRDLSPSLSKRLFAYTAMVDDIERIGDHAVNIVKLSKVKFQRQIDFSRFAVDELKAIEGLIMGNLDDAAALISGHDGKKVSDIQRREDAVDLQVKEARERHLARFHKRVCPAEAGPIFVELLIHLERISDHCQNIAEYIEDLEL